MWLFKTSVTFNHLGDAVSEVIVIDGVGYKLYKRGTSQWAIRCLKGPHDRFDDPGDAEFPTREAARQALDQLLRATDILKRSR